MSFGLGLDWVLVSSSFFMLAIIPSTSLCKNCQSPSILAVPLAKGHAPQAAFNRICIQPKSLRIRGTPLRSLCEHPIKMALSIHIKWQQIYMYIYIYIYYVLLRMTLLHACAPQTLDTLICMCFLVLQLDPTQILRRARRAAQGIGEQGGRAAQQRAAQ
jgi:hypothetical protein